MAKWDKTQPIAFITGTFPENAQKWFIEQVISLIDLGVDIRLFAFHPNKETWVADDILRYKLLERTTYLSVPESRFTRWALVPLYLLRLFLYRPAALLKVFTPGGRHSPSLQYLFWAVPLIGKIEACAVTHCHFGMIANKYLLIKDILGLKQPIVTTLYGQDSSKFIKQKGPHAYDQLKKDGSMLLTMTEEMKERMIQSGFPATKVRVHYTGILIDNHPFIERVYYPGEKFKIGFTGRFVEKKGITDLFRAIQLVVKKHSNIEVHLYGGSNDVEYNAEVDHVLKECKLESCVTLHGMVPYKKLPEALASIHLLVQPSKTATNGDTDDLPVVLLEAQASGLPVLSTRHVGIPDGVDDGKSGFLVPEGDFVAVAEKIIYAIEHPEILAPMGRRAREFMHERFDLIPIDKRLMELYGEITDTGDV